MWRCKKCGAEIKVRFIINDIFDFNLEKDGELGELDVFEGMKIDEYIKENSNFLEKVYVCEECWQKVCDIDELEEIAYWED